MTEDERLTANAIELAKTIRRIFRETLREEMRAELEAIRGPATTSILTKINPCPKCGNAAVAGEPNASHPTVRVQCLSNILGCVAGPVRQTKVEAIDAWNSFTRKPPTPDLGELRALVAELGDNWLERKRALQFTIALDKLEAKP